MLVVLDLEGYLAFIGSRLLVFSLLIFLTEPVPLDGVVQLL